MKQNYLWLGLLALSTVYFVTVDALAGVHVNNDQLTVVVEEVPLKDCLEDLGQQGQFLVTILDPQILDGEITTQDFQHLPVEEGLARLLAGWNYGLRKTVDGKHILELFLVSKRTHSGALSQPTNSLPTATSTMEAANDPYNSSTTDIEELKHAQETDGYPEREGDRFLLIDQEQPEPNLLSEDLLQNWP